MNKEFLIEWQTVKQKSVIIEAKDREEAEAKFYMLDYDVDTESETDCDIDYVEISEQ